MTPAMTDQELEKLVELTRRVAEQNERKSSNAVALEETRKEIREHGQFVPRIEQPNQIEVCF